VAVSSGVNVHGVKLTKDPHLMAR